VTKVTNVTPFSFLMKILKTLYRDVRIFPENPQALTFVTFVTPPMRVRGCAVTLRNLLPFLLPWEYRQVGAGLL
jgi:hypothetical protein